MSPQHVTLLNYSLNQYDIKPSMFIDEIFAAGLAYGWYPDQHSDDGLNETVLFAIGHSGNMVFGLVQYTKGKMILENCWSINQLGLRDMQLWFVKKFLKQACEDFDEVDGDAIMKSGFSRMSLMSELKESFISLAALDCDEVSARSDNVMDDETVVVDIKSQEFDEQVRELFMGKIDEIMVKIKEVSE